MPTAVLRLDLADLPPAVAVDDRYESALILLLYRGHPLGKCYVPVVKGFVCGPGMLEQTVTESVFCPLRQRWLWEYLGWEEAPQYGDFPKATAVVCTRDRPDDLHRCLKVLAPLARDGHEVLVIDNCPKTDATYHLAQEHFPNVRYVREDRPGLNVARNRALREARHEIVAFNDDDTVPEPGWLPNLIRNFSDPTVLCTTGLIMPLELETTAQEWFEYYSPLGRGFARRVFDGTNSDPLVAAQVGAGANMALRRDLSAVVGPFDEALDAGTLTRSGRSHEMFYRILKNGYRIIYDPDAISWHRHRRTHKELQDAFYGYGVGMYAYWTRCLVVEKDWRVLLHSLSWLLRGRLPGLFRSAFRRPGALQLRFAVAEILGCAAGPSAYFRSRKRVPARIGFDSVVVREGTN